MKFFALSVLGILAVVTTALALWLTAHPLFSALMFPFAMIFWLLFVIYLLRVLRP